MVIFPTSIASYMIMVGAYSRVGSGSRLTSSMCYQTLPRLNGSGILSVSTPTSRIVIISSPIPALTPIPICSLCVQSVIGSVVTLSIIGLIVTSVT